MARLSLLFQMRLNPGFVSKIFEKIEEEQFRSLIRLLFFEAKFREKIKECLDAICGEYFPSITSFKDGFHKFQSYRTRCFYVSRINTPSIKVAQDSCESRHLQKSHGSYPA